MDFYLAKFNIQNINNKQEVIDHLALLIKTMFPVKT